MKLIPAITKDHQLREMTSKTLTLKLIFVSVPIEFP